METVKVDDLEARASSVSIRTIKCTCPPHDPCRECECGDKAFNRDAPTVTISVDGQVIKTIP